MLDSTTDPHAAIRDAVRAYFAGEYDVEPKFRETRLHQVAPISTNPILSAAGRACPRPAAELLTWRSRLPTPSQG